MLARLSAFVIWALVAGSLVFWGFRLLVSAPATPPYAVGVGEASAPPGNIARVLGSDVVAGPAAPPPEASRFQLLGVVAPRADQGGAPGVALIVVDGRPARAFRIGAPLIDDWVLQGVTHRTASLGPSQAAPVVVLELPERPGPATGTLPTADGIEAGVPRSAGASVAPMQVPQMPSGMPMGQVSPGATPPYQEPPQVEAPPLPSTGMDAPPQPSDASADGAAGPAPGMGPPRRGMPESR